MRVTDLDAQIPDQIGHAFGYYDYGEEIGMDSFFRSKDAVADYIAGYVRMAFAGGMLYGIREPGRAISPISCRDRSWALERAWNL